MSALLYALHARQLAVPNGVHDRHCVEGQVADIAQLAADGKVAQDRIGNVLVVQSDQGGLQVLGKLPDAQYSAGGAKLLLHGIVGVDGRLRLVQTVQVPGIEAREVLDRAEHLVARDCVGLDGLAKWVGSFVVDCSTVIWAM